MVGGVKQLLLICSVMVLVGCASGPKETTEKAQPPKPKVIPNSPEAVAAVEAAIRKAAKKPTGELTKADFEKVTELVIQSLRLTSLKGLRLEKLTNLKLLALDDNQLVSVAELGKLTQLDILVLCYNKLTNVKGLEKLTQLSILEINGNPALTKAQIAKLQKALPNCAITF